MSIEKERSVLLGQLDRLQARLERIKDALFSTGGSVSAPAATKAAAPPKKGRAERGELKQRILEALAAAGKDGMRVRDLAAAIGAKPAALHSWFQFARKRIPAIRKAGKGRYRLVGKLPEPTAAAPKAKPARAARKSKGNKRGHLSDTIQAALKAAGKDGIRVGDLAKTLGVNQRNLFVWFATTGKKFKAIKKSGPGHYHLQG